MADLFKEIQEFPVDGCIGCPRQVKKSNTQLSFFLAFIPQVKVETCLAGLPTTLCLS